MSAVNVPPNEHATLNIAPTTTSSSRPTKRGSKFLSPFAPVRRDPTPLLELRLRWLSATIQEKPHWWEKVHDPTIVTHWSSEIVEHDRMMVDKLWGGEKWYEVGEGEKQWLRERITEAQLNYLFNELECLVGQEDREILVHPKSYQSKESI
ncbi:hypothetical protein C8Q78DRAFT_1096815 [Trametes maxima]|nr:hypothetical protein C8Q78DRAFT_1096815 [Trametes maxima]